MELADPSRAGVMVPVEQNDEEDLLMLLMSLNGAALPLQTCTMPRAIPQAVLHRNWKSFLFCWKRITLFATAENGTQEMK